MLFYLDENQNEADVPEELVDEPPVVEIEEPEEKIKKRQWYNMVTYGLPNLIVTQI